MDALKEQLNSGVHALSIQVSFYHNATGDDHEGLRMYRQKHQNNGKSPAMSQHHHHAWEALKDDQPVPVTKFYRSVLIRLLNSNWPINSTKCMISTYWIWLEPMIADSRLVVIKKNAHLKTAELRFNSELALTLD